MSEIEKNRTLSDGLKLDGFLDHKTPMGSVIYSPQYSDETHVYRHVTIPKKMAKVVNLLVATKPKDKRFLEYDEIVRKLHIPMSPDWEHYLTHDRDMTLLFRRKRRDG